jgi:hypothetical protein
MQNQQTVYCVAGDSAKGRSQQERKRQTNTRKKKIPSYIRAVIHSKNCRILIPNTSHLMKSVCLYQSQAAAKLRGGNIATATPHEDSNL